MPKRKSRNQSLKQRVKALEMHLGMQAFGLNSRWGIKTDGAGRVSGFGLHSPDVAPAGFHLQATDVEVDGVKVPKGAYMDASEINRVSTQWARFGELLKVDNISRETSPNGQTSFSAAAQAINAEEQVRASLK